MTLFNQETCLFDDHGETFRVQVFSRGDVVELRFGNSVTQSARSRSNPDALLLEYTRGMMAGLLFAPQARNVLHVGLGAGSIPSYIHRHFPGVRQRVVELNRAVIDVAFRFFDTPRSPRLEIVEDDGANHLRLTPDRFDLIFLDGFHAEGAASNLVTKTFLASAMEHLSSGGWLVTNTWGSHSELLRTIMITLRTLFPELHALSVRMDSNVILFSGAPREPTTRAGLRAQAAALSASVPLDFTELADRIRIGKNLGSP